MAVGRENVERCPSSVASPYGLGLVGCINNSAQLHVTLGCLQMVGNLRKEAIEYGKVYKDLHFYLGVSSRSRSLSRSDAPLTPVGGEPCFVPQGDPMRENWYERTN